MSNVENVKEEVIEQKEIKPTKENKDVFNLNTEDEEDEESLVIKLKKPYKFEGEEYRTVDFTALEDFTTQQMINLEKKMAKKKIHLFNPEMQIQFVPWIGNEITGLPIEFFKGLPTGESLNIKNRVIDFFYN